jgi:hypothetical protein
MKMKMKRGILIVLASFIVLISFTTNAQDKDSHEARMEKYRAEKVSFLTTKLSLSPAEAEKFWPIYNQMDKERWEAQKCRRNLEDRVSEAEESLSDNEIIKLTREYSGSMQKEAALMTNYNEKLLKVLPPKKVLKLYKAENEFRMTMIRKYRDNKGDKGEK